MISGRYDGCYYVRQYLPQMFNGWQGSYITPSQRRDDKETYKIAMASDIVVFHRPEHPNLIKQALMLQQLGKKIVYDNDDTFKEIGGSSTTEHADMVKVYNNRLYDFAKIADLVTVSTRTLANEYKDINPNVVVLPNQVYKDHFPEPIKNKTDKIRVGLIGSAAYYNDWKEIEPLLRKIANDDRYTLVVYGFVKDNKVFKSMYEKYKVEIKAVQGLGNIEQHEWTNLDKYLDTLNSLALDIVLIPREDTYFNECKSNLKFLEMSMLEIPVIAKSFKNHNSPYDNDITNGVNGFLSKDLKEFESYFNLLSNDSKLRKSIGKEARTYTLAHYNIENNYKLWYNTYNKLLK